MEKLYIKKKNGRYQEYGFAYNKEIPNGIWIIDSNPNFKSQSSVFWKVGDLNKITDVTTHAAVQSMSDDLSNYLVALKDENSNSYKDAKNILGGYLNGPVNTINISPADLVQLLLRQIALKIEENDREK